MMNDDGGMYNASHRYKIMEHLQIGNMFLNTFSYFIQQQELIQNVQKCEQTRPL